MDLSSQMGELTRRGTHEMAERCEEVRCAIRRSSSACRESGLRRATSVILMGVIVRHDRLAQTGSKPSRIETVTSADVASAVLGAIPETQ